VRVRHGPATVISMAAAYATGETWEGAVTERCKSGNLPHLLLQQSFGPKVGVHEIYFYRLFNSHVVAPGWL